MLKRCSFVHILTRCLLERLNELNPRTTVFDLLSYIWCRDPGLTAYLKALGQPLVNPLSAANVKSTPFSNKKISISASATANSVSDVINSSGGQWSITAVGGGASSIEASGSVLSSLKEANLASGTGLVVLDTIDALANHLWATIIRPWSLELDDKQGKKPHPRFNVHPGKKRETAIKTIDARYQKWTTKNCKTELNFGINLCVNLIIGV